MGAEISSGAGSVNSGQLNNAPNGGASPSIGKHNSRQVMEVPEVSPQLPPNEVAESGVKKAPSLSERPSEVRSNVTSKLNPDKTSEYQRNQNGLKGIDSHPTASKSTNTVRESISQWH